MPQSQEHSPSGGHQFGTFAGVFTPSVLTIFGLIMYMRAGYVVGQGGIFWSIMVLLLAKGIVLATALSISAISTNTQVKGGGAYYLISRTLGPGFGSSIGVALFFAQTLSVPFYIFGFSEAIANNFPNLTNYYLYIAVGTGILLFALTIFGADWAMKVQYFILGVLGLSIITFLAGSALSFDRAVFAENWQRPSTNPLPLAAVFALYFPAVTGIMAGVNMSGDLKNPMRSIPRGSLYAIALATVVYGVQMLLMGGAYDRYTLIHKPYMVLVENALFGAGFLVTAGVVAATLSSALGSYMGAPRIIQALAKDEIIPPLNPLAKGSGPHNEPRRALVLTLLIAMGMLVWGGIQGLSEDGLSPALNAVTEVVTMFFLYTYGMVNLAAFVESYGKNPSFRPKFRFFHWTTALFGAVSCIGVSFLINWMASLAALAFIGILFTIVSRRDLEATFGDARRGFVYSRIRDNLLMLSEMPPHPKNWRPTIAVLVSNPHARRNLLEYACLFECKRGIVSLVEFMIGDFAELNNERLQEQKNLEALANESKLNFFPEVVVVNDFDRGLTTFLQGHSIGPVKPNVVMFGWPKMMNRVDPFLRHLRTISTLGMSYVILFNSESAACPQSPSGRIDIWWRGRENGSLMLILAYLLVCNNGWKRVKLRLLRIVRNESDIEEGAKELSELVEASRIPADINVVCSEDSFDSILENNSGDALLLFMGFGAPSGTEIENQAFYEATTKRLKKLPPSFLVCSSGQADLMA